jgi:hypothetical protein
MWKSAKTRSAAIRKAQHTNNLNPTESGRFTSNALAEKKKLAPKLLFADGAKDENLAIIGCRDCNRGYKRKLHLQSHNHRTHPAPASQAATSGEPAPPSRSSSRVAAYESSNKASLLQVRNPHFLNPSQGFIDQPEIRNHTYKTFSP